jgi:putative transposase
VFRHVRTRVRSPQTNGVVERFFGTLKYEHRYRATIGDGNALAVEVNLFRHTYNTRDPTRPSTNAHHARLTSPSNTAISV